MILSNCITSQVFNNTFEQGSLSVRLLKLSKRFSREEDLTLPVHVYPFYFAIGLDEKVVNYLIELVSFHHGR